MSSPVTVSSVLQAFLSLTRRRESARQGLSESTATDRWLMLAQAAWSVF
jgi:hypothetical protein